GGGLAGEDANGGLDVPAGVRADRGCYAGGGEDHAADALVHLPHVGHVGARFAERAAQLRGSVDAGADTVGHGQAPAASNVGMPTNSNVTVFSGLVPTSPAMSMGSTVTVPTMLFPPRFGVYRNGICLPRFVQSHSVLEFICPKSSSSLTSAVADSVRAPGITSPESTVRGSDFSTAGMILHPTQVVANDLRSE